MQTGMTVMLAWGRLFVLLLLFLGLTLGPMASSANAGQAPEDSAILTDIQTYGNFETAGIDIKFGSPITTETATLAYRKSGEDTYQAGHPFTQYDGNHMATSLFDLTPDTTYELRIEVTGPHGSSTHLASVTTKPEYSLPTPTRTVNVATQMELVLAIADLRPGDHILLDPAGIYTEVALNGKSGTATQPILIGSQSTARPKILGPVKLQRSNYVVITNLEVHNERGHGVDIWASHHNVVINCYVHDSLGGPGTYAAGIYIRNSELGDMPGVGAHLIMDNIIGDDDHEPVTDSQGPGPSNRPNARQTNYGIKAMYNPGGFTTIRNNVIYGVVDGMSPLGDEQGAAIDPTVPDFLATHPLTNQNLDVYDNIIYDVKDDAIEADGIVVNARFFRNLIGKAQASFSIAPILPGPVFIVKNAAYGAHENNTKLNNGFDVVTRNVYIYNNTFVQKPGHTKGVIYRGEPAQTQDIVYKNNIFLAQTRIINSDMYAPGSFHENHLFDYNLGYTALTSGPRYKWATVVGDALNNTRYDSLEGFRAATGQEANGKYGDPLLDLSPLADYPASSLLHNLRIASPDSPAIDAGALIPGITNHYHGSAPDIGAYEFD